MSLSLDEIKSHLTSDGIWQLDNDIEQILKRQLESLPISKILSQQEYRYPQDKYGLRGFMDKFFARHFFQVQNAVIQPDCFERILDALNYGSVTISDIGCGPAVTSLALLNIFSNLSCYVHKRVNVNIILNDTVPELLSTGYRMLTDYVNKTEGVNISRIILLSNAFPQSMVQLERISRLLSRYDFCCLSYSLVPLKASSTYLEIQENLQNFFSFLKPKGIGIVIQDKFRESLSRKIGFLIKCPVQKLTLRQKIYDSQNSCDSLSYEYFRIAILPDMAQGVSNRFCLQ